MQAEAQAQLMRSEADGDFRDHIDLFDPSHHLASPTTVHDACHDVGFPSSRRSMSEAGRSDGDIDVPRQIAFIRNT